MDTAFEADRIRVMSSLFVWILRFNSIAAVALGTLLLPYTTHAQFSDFTNNTDTGWTRYDPLGGLGAGAKANFSVTSCRVPGISFIRGCASRNRKPP